MLGTSNSSECQNQTKKQFDWCTELVQLTICHQCHHIVGNLCTNEYIWQSIACTCRNPNGTSKTLPLHCAIYQAGCSCSTILLGQSAWDDEQAGTNIEQQSNKQLSSFSVCLPVLLVFPGSSAYKQSWSVNPTAAVAKRPLKLHTRAFWQDFLFVTYFLKTSSSWKIQNE